MMKKLTALAILSGVLGGGVYAMSIDRTPSPIEKADDGKVKAVVDARLHQLLVEMRLKRALR